MIKTTTGDNSLAVVFCCEAVWSAAENQRLLTRRNILKDMRR